MKNRKHLVLCLSILGGSFLFFVSQNNLKSSNSNSEKERTNSLEDVISFHSDATGDQFSGEKIRTFSVSDFLFNDGTDKIPNAMSFEEKSFDEKSFLKSRGCDKWGVMTTISSPPSEAVRRFLYMKDWCVVVVADFNKPEVRTSDSF